MWENHVVGIQTKVALAFIAGETCLKVQKNQHTRNSLHSKITNSNLEVLKGLRVQKYFLDPLLLKTKTILVGHSSFELTRFYNLVNCQPSTWVCWCVCNCVLVASIRVGAVEKWSIHSSWINYLRKTRPNLREWWMYVFQKKYIYYCKRWFPNKFSVIFTNQKYSLF